MTREERKIIEDISAWSEAIKTLFAEPQKRGYWILTKKEKITYAECSICGTVYSITETTYDFSNAKFCPNCGLKMMGSEEANADSN